MFKHGDWQVCIPLKKFRKKTWDLILKEIFGMINSLIFTGLPMEEPGIDGWRTLFITRPRVNFINEFLCVISRNFEILNS